MLIGVSLGTALVVLPPILSAHPEARAASATADGHGVGKIALDGPAAPPSLGPFAPAPDIGPPAPAPAPAPALRTGLAEAAVDAAEDEASDSTELAVAVLDRATGELAVGDRGDEPFLTASLSKVVMAVDVLDRRRLEGLAVADGDVELLGRALGPSDDSAMNALWSRFDGAGAAARLSSRLGLTATAGPRDPSQWGEVEVPASDTVRIWHHILTDMPAANRDLLIAAMDGSPTTARDGFDQTYGLLSPAVDGPAGPGAVAKQGWMCCIAGQYHLHSAGAVGADQRFVVALLSRMPRGGGWESARAEVSAIADGVVRALA